MSGQMVVVLHGLGLGPGDRLVAQTHKSADAVFLYLACLRAGVVYIPLNITYTSHELSYFLEDARPSLVVADPAIPAQPGPLWRTLAADGSGTFSAESRSVVPFADIAPTAAEDVAVIVYTSGTTGRSKGAMLTHTNLVSNAVALHQIWAFEPGDVLLHVLPIFHVHGLMVALHTAMLNGSEVVFLPSFEVDEVIRELPLATVLMGVPTHHTRLLADERFDADLVVGMRLFTSGSAPMTAVVHEAFSQRTGHRILERYGMSEAGMITSNPYEGDRVAGTVGFPLPGVEIRVCEENGRELEPGGTGVIEVRGPNVFVGYWEQPDKTQEVFRADGFFVTGDVGRLDTEGRLTLEGRDSDMIISGGLNVYPKEVEMLLDDSEAVAESAVVGLPHPDLGEAVTAFIVPAAGSKFDLDAVVQSLDGVLARFKMPKRYIVIDTLPRNVMGKVQKSELRANHQRLYGGGNQPPD